MNSRLDLGEVMTELPAYAWAVVFLGVVGLPAATLAVLARGARSAGSDGGARTTARTVAWVGGVAWAGWVAGTAALAAAGFYRQRPDGINLWLAGTLVVALAALLLGARIPVVTRILADPDTPARLILPQTFRVAGGVFLIALALDELPAVFAVPAGVGDILVGLAAPLVAWRVSRGATRAGVAFNVLGLLDLVVAVTLGFLAGLGPTNLLDVTPSTQAVTALPLVLVPAVAVPVAAALHVVSLRGLRRLSPDHRPRTAVRSG
jgi:hypothetical protein